MVIDSESESVVQKRASININLNQKVMIHGRQVLNMGEYNLLFNKNLFKITNVKVINTCNATKKIL